MNYRSHPVRVIDMELIADPGLSATYLGHSGCRLLPDLAHVEVVDQALGGCGLRVT